jgi:hypothetical protein
MRQKHNFNARVIGPLAYNAAKVSVSHSTVPLHRALTFPALCRRSCRRRRQQPYSARAATAAAAATEVVLSPFQRYKRVYRDIYFFGGNSFSPKHEQI